MKIGRTTFVLAALASATALVAACAPSTPPTPAASPPSAQGAAARPQSQVHGDLRQVMRGILFPNSNVVFFAQSNDPATVPKDADGTTSVNPLASVYGGWDAIENSSIALAEAANLLTIPGRTCAHGEHGPCEERDRRALL